MKMSQSRTVILCTDICLINVAVKLTTLSVYRLYLNQLWAVCFQSHNSHFSTDDVIGQWTNPLLSSQFLNTDPRRRLGAGGDTRSILRHPFFKTLDWEAVFQKRVRPPFRARTSDVSTKCVFILCHNGQSLKLLLKGTVTVLH